MKCFISKIIIDNRDESGKELPRLVSTHLGKCPDCQAYRSLSRQLSSADPYDRFSDLSMTELNRKISTDIYNCNSGKENRFKRKIFSPVPIAVLFFIVIIALGIILFQGINKPLENNTGKPLINIAATGNIKSIHDLFSQVESPIKREAEELKKSMKSAGKYLRSVMNFGLPGLPN